MSEPDATIGAAYPGVIRVGRRCAAVLVGGVLAALAWMFVMQEGHTGRIFGATWTDQDFPDGLGHAAGASNTARGGLYLTLLLGVGLAALFVAIRARLPGRGFVKGLWFAPIPFLLWGLVFAPLVDARQVLRGADFVFLPTGVFGLKAGGGTIVSGVVASLIAGAIIGRVVQVMANSTWWEPHPQVGLGRTGGGAEALLELAEERTEERVEGTR
jgi:hypothetical protein